MKILKFWIAGWRIQKLIINCWRAKRKGLNIVKVIFILLLSFSKYLSVDIGTSRTKL
jgi:hypothetical protein